MASDSETVARGQERSAHLHADARIARVAVEVEEPVAGVHAPAVCEGPRQHRGLRPREIGAVVADVEPTDVARDPKDDGLREIDAEAQAENGIDPLRVITEPNGPEVDGDMDVGIDRPVPCACENLASHMPRVCRAA